MEFTDNDICPARVGHTANSHGTRTDKPPFSKQNNVRRAFANVRSPKPGFWTLIQTTKHQRGVRSSSLPNGNPDAEKYEPETVW